MNIKAKLGRFKPKKFGKHKFSTVHNASNISRKRTPFSLKRIYRLPNLKDSLYMRMIALLPENRFGNIMRICAGWQGSNRLSKTLLNIFVKYYNVNTFEAEKHLSEYPNIHSFFIRKLHTTARVIDNASDVIVSPVDGVVASCSQIEERKCLQIKGKFYTIDDLLGNANASSSYHHGYLMTFYLSPKNYHRIHSPFSGNLVRFHHIHGRKFPVNPPSVRSVDNLFVINERIITYLEIEENKEIAIVKVAALGVGNIRVTYADINKKITINNKPIKISPPYHIHKGEEIGFFELGSTVIVIFPPDLITPRNFEHGMEIKIGEKIATLKGPK